MRTILLVQFLHSLGAVAFPSWLISQDLDPEELERIAQIATMIESSVSELSQTKDKRSLGFDAQKQHVSVHGAHEFVREPKMSRLLKLFLIFI